MTIRMARALMPRSPSTAFSVGETAAIKQAIVNMRNNVAPYPFEFSFPDFLRTFAEASHRQLLLEVPGVVLGYWSGAGAIQGSSIWGSDLLADISIQCDVRYAALPKFIEVQPDADPAILARFRDWVVDAIKVATDFGRVMFIFEELNKRCATAEQVRFIWPSVLALIAKCPGLEPLRDKLSGVPACRSLPPLDADFRRLIKAASVSVTTALMAPDRTAKAEVNARSVHAYVTGPIAILDGNYTYHRLF